MLYLYFGYLLVQLNAMIDVISKTKMSLIALIFSITVFLVWALIPILGYSIVRLLKNEGEINSKLLFGYGIMVAMIEKGLFKFNVLSSQYQNMSILFVMIMFALIAFYPFPYASRISD